MTNEVWKKVAGHDRFLVSNMGRVMCIDYMKKGEVADVKQSKSGEYMRVRVDKENLYVHVLVAKAFIGDIAEGKCVSFLNGDKTDCRAVNLQIVDDPSKLVFSESLCVTAYNLHTGKVKTFDSIKAAAGELGVSRNVISDICHSKYKSKYHAGYTFCFGKHGVEAFTALAGDIAKENAEKKARKNREKAKTVAPKNPMQNIVPAKGKEGKKIIKEVVNLNDMKALNRAFSCSPVFAFNEKTGVITYFNSVKEAAENFGVSVTALSLVLNGKNRNMPACLKGYKLAKNRPDSLIA